MEIQFLTSDKGLTKAFFIEYTVSDLVLCDICMG
jgi:hypothetical protein